VLLTEALSVSLSLLKVGMLDCVAMDVAPSYWTSLRGVGSGCLSPGFSWNDGPSNTGGFSEVVLPGGWFVSSCWSLLPKGKAETENFDCSLFNLLPDSPR
jgi:hypothetical protein